MNAAVLVLYSSIVARSGATEGDGDVAPTMGLSLSGSSHPAFETGFVVMSQPCTFV